MKEIFKNHWPVLALAFFCLLLVSIWFKDGKLLATGEEGLILTNPRRSIELYKYSWIDVGPGIAAPGANPMIPLFYLEAYALSSGIPAWVFQATIFYLLMFIGSCSIYYLTRKIFNNISNEAIKVKMALIAAIFYILNPVSLLGVWYRFLLGFMFFYALVPLFFYLFIIGVSNKKLIMILIAPLVALFFSFAFAAPALILLLWFLPFMYSLSLSWTRSLNGRLTFKKFPLIYFCLSFGFWVLINLWWIFPYYELSKVAFASETDPVHAIGTLKANSRDFTLANVIRLIHGGFLYRGEGFGSVYKTPIFLLISWAAPIIVFYGLFKLQASRIKVFFASSLILLSFLVKGTSPPFGGVFLWLFTHITFLQVYRNPLEKIGMLLPTISAPLFSFGLFCFLQKIQGFKKRTLIFMLALASLAVFHLPFFSGALSSYGERDIRVMVPSSFQRANEAIPKGNHILLSIPVMGGASGFYKWQYGYKGVESSEYLFNYPVITKFYDATSFYGQMLIGISKGDINNLTGLAQVFSADIIAYRKDTDVEAFGYNLDALDRSEKMINKSNLNKIFDSQEVSLWSLPKEKIVPVIYSPNSVKFGDSSQGLISLLENDQFDPKQQMFICTNKDKCKPYFTSQDVSKIKIEAIPEKIEFKKISPVKYDIRVNNSSGKFLLVFNRTYHPGWTAFAEDRPISSEKHFIANGYANGFIIDEKGSFNISLQFAPDKKIATAYKISLLAISLGIVMLLGLILHYFLNRQVLSL